MSIAELELDSTGRVLEFGPCPEFVCGDGAVVTGRIVTHEVPHIVQLLTEQGPMAVASANWDFTPQSVFNLEINGEHVYQVTDLGILVHNAIPLFCRFVELLKKKAAGEAYDPGTTKGSGVFSEWNNKGGRPLFSVISPLLRSKVDLRFHFPWQNCNSTW